MQTWRLLVGDVREQLALLPEASVQCVVTSPPYWGLRDYGAVGQLGLERTPYEYVEAMVDVFAGVWRVLRDDGSLYLNLGDCYATGAGSVGEHPGGGAQGARWRGDVDRVRDDKRGYRGDRLVNTNSGTVARTKTQASRGARMPIPSYVGKHTGIVGMGPMTQPNRMPIDGLKPKDLIGVPWRVALALQADGWYLRQAMPWLKRNGMPESTEDRPTTTVEYLFLLTKSETYFYDPDAVMKIGAIAAGTRAAKGSNKRSAVKDVNGRPPEYWEYTGERLRRSSDWFFESFEGLLGDEDGQPIALVANTKPYAEAHFATFPPRLVEPCVLAATSEKGCCSKCGKPIQRIIERSPMEVTPAPKREKWQAEDDHARTQVGGTMTSPPRRKTIAWEADCSCAEPPSPCIVLDPFAGSGTTGQVAIQHGRSFIGIELNPEYAELARKRIGGAAPLFAEAVS